MPNPVNVRAGAGGADDRCQPLRHGPQSGVIPGVGCNGIPLEERLLLRMAAEAGYRTALVGKWHLGHGDPDA